MKATAQPLIVITGFMGAGKTTVAAALARLRACSMIDLDGFIAAREGRGPREIIDEDGEPRFRQIESGALRAALAMDEARVIALGGGAWTIEGNRQLLREREAFVVWLDAPFALCWRRIMKAAGARPLARDEALALELYQKRRELYALARLRVEADERSSPSQLAAGIEAEVKLFQRIKEGERQ
ncbi:MAG: shikimate kinase [Blastocatellia bacterium]|jgi:shikimate kinase|nr:shikimate kinase [Blastocatellia bacterium]